MLADDSHDEKKIEKAEKAAERKLAKRRKVQEVKLREGLAARSLRRPGSEPIHSKHPLRVSCGAETEVPLLAVRRPRPFQEGMPKAAPSAGVREEYLLIKCVEYVAMEGVECVDRENVASW